MTIKSKGFIEKGQPTAEILMTEGEKQMRASLKKKLKGELLDEAIFYMKIANAAKPLLHDAGAERLSWKTLPFIPEDLGFKEHIADGAAKGDPELTIRIYYKDGVTCTKDFTGMWVISKKDMNMSFKIRNKFVAFQIFSAIGMKFSQADSTVPDVEVPITDILKEGE